MKQCIRQLSLHQTFLIPHSRVLITTALFIVGSTFTKVGNRGDS